MNTPNWLMNYAVIRFMPHRETAEFVNIGVVAACPQIDFFDYKIRSKRATRVSRFFPELPGELYAKSVEALKRALDAHRQNEELWTTGQRQLPHDLTMLRLHEFQSLTKQRESILHFGPARSLLVTNPAKATEDLFDQMVNRSFADKPDYYEKQMKTRLAQCLREWDLRGFYKSDVRVGNATYHVNLPFVASSQGQQVAAIKPLDLNRPESTDVYLHGDEWVSKMRRLKQLGSLPRNTVTPVEMPQLPGPSKDAAVDVCSGLQQLGVHVVSIQDLQQLHSLILPQSL
jgi:hypothetical protein